MPVYPAHFAGSGSPANRFDPSTSVYNWKAANTRRARRGFGRASAADPLGFNVVIIGDSISDDTPNNGVANWTKVIYDELSVSSHPLPAGGTGIVQCTAATSTSGLDLRWSYTGTGDHINGRYGFLNSTGATATFNSAASGEAWSGQRGTDVHLWYYQSSANFTVQVDGGTAVPVTTTKVTGESIAHYVVTGLANTTHTLTVTNPGGNDAFGNPGVYPVAAGVSGPSGVRVHRLARSGILSAAFADTTSQYQYTTPFAAALSTAGWTPDVTFIALGTNDVHNSVTSAQFAANITAIANYWVGQGSDVVLVAGYEPGDLSAGVWATYVQALYGVADSRNLPLIDLYDRSGGYAVANAAGLMFNIFGHPSLVAHRDWGRVATTLLRDL